MLHKAYLYFSEVMFNRKYSVLLLLFVSTLGLAIFGISSSTINADYGIDSAEAVETYLNNKLPSIDPDAGQSWSIVDAYPNLTFVNPIYFAQEPGTDKVWVAEHAGKIYRFDHRTGVTESEREVILDITGRVKQDAVSGIKSFAFHPEYGQAGSPNAKYIYIFYRYTPSPPSSDDDAYLRVSRFTTNNNGIDNGSEFVLINQFSRNRWHDGGDMFFGDDGFLYISLGEDTNPRHSQRLDGGLFGGVCSALMLIKMDRRVTRFAGSHRVMVPFQTDGRRAIHKDISYPTIIHGLIIIAGISKSFMPSDSGRHTA